MSNVENAEESFCDLQDDLQYEDKVLLFVISLLCLGSNICPSA